MNLFDKAKNNFKKTSTLWGRYNGKKHNSTCLECEKSFDAKPSDIKRGWGIFCSKSCSAKFRFKDKGVSEEREFKLKKILGI